MASIKRHPALWATCLLAITFINSQTSGQSIKGSSNNQLSSSFAQIFNSLTPVQQQQFVRQMSSSNRRILQQMLFAPQTNQFSSFDERFESSSVPSLQQGTKSAKFSIQQQNKGSLSPVQQAQLIRNQHLIQQQQHQQSSIPTSDSGSSSFSSEFFSSKSAPPPRQQSSYFNRVQEVKQVSRPVVVQPVTEHSFRRVQSFSSQPLPVPQQQQFVQQHFFQKHSQEQPVIPSSFNQFSSSSSSSSSNLAGDSGFLSGSGGGFDASGFSSAALQQKKLDSGSLENSFGIQQQQENFDNVLDFSQEQQNNLLPDGGELSGGLMAASINNRWYIMKPIENPSAFGLRRVRIPESQVVDIGRLNIGPASRVSGGASVAPTLTSSASTSNRRSLTGKPEARTGDEEAAAAATAAVAATGATSTPAAATTRAGASFEAASTVRGPAPGRSGAPPGERIQAASNNNDNNNKDDEKEVEETDGDQK